MPINAELSNFSEHLTLRAELSGNQVALWVPFSKKAKHIGVYTPYTFRTLDQDVTAAARGLMELGITPRTKVTLMVKPSYEFFVLVFALYRMQAIPVLIDPGLGLKGLKQCLSEAAPTAFIGITAAHVARILFGWRRGQWNQLVHVGSKSSLFGTSFERLMEMGRNSKKPMPVGDINAKAAIVFTSGSTGVPKGVEYTHKIFLTQVKRLSEITGIQPGEIDLCTFPLFAMFSPALGMTSIIPIMNFTKPGEVDGNRILGPVKQFGVTNFFGSPALIRKLTEDFRGKGIMFDTLKRACTAGAPLPVDTLEEFSKMIPETTQVFTPYGATESLPVCWMGSHELLKETVPLTMQGKGVCVGRPVPETEVKIIKITDEAIPTWDESLLEQPGVVGEIIVRGDQVTRTYYNRDEATKLAKIQIPGSDGFYHRMGDLGYIDEKGRVWFCGRKVHRIETSQKTLFAVPCEGVFNHHKSVRRTALVGVKSSKGLEPVLCIETPNLPDPQERQRIISELRSMGAKVEDTKPIEKFLFKEKFPVDIRHNSKIFREKLAVWAEGEMH